MLDFVAMACLYAQSSMFSRRNSTIPQYVVPNREVGRLCMCLLLFCFVLLRSSLAHHVMASTDRGETDIRMRALL